MFHGKAIIDQHRKSNYSADIIQDGDGARTKVESCLICGATQLPVLYTFRNLPTSLNHPT
jgi:hypothetical protein